MCIGWSVPHEDLTWNWIEQYDLKDFFFFPHKGQTSLLILCVSISIGSIWDPIHSSETEQKSNPASVGDLVIASAMITEALLPFLCLYAFLKLKLQKDWHIS